ncbi:hypothetical protein EYF80_055181 [Liparis tanakae]|uniref:Uncharacterized protein n=1 Tax=Liparis tanakae TaxID=230148 RepID=A0A4Z2F2D5_9TELE|nr:hypothetical protein EYF80_055181 [Liparis tanakae]
MSWFLSNSAETGSRSLRTWSRFPPKNETPSPPPDRGRDVKGGEEASYSPSAAAPRRGDGDGDGDGEDDEATPSGTATTRLTGEETNGLTRGTLSGFIFFMPLFFNQMKAQKPESLGSPGAQRRLLLVKGDASSQPQYDTLIFLKPTQGDNLSLLELILRQASPTCRANAKVKPRASLADGRRRAKRGEDSAGSRAQLMFRQHGRRTRQRQSAAMLLRQL